MPRRIKDRNVWLINATIMLVGMGCGMAISIMAVFLDERGYSYTDIGAFASWSALGLVSFSLPAGACIRKYSARATLLVGLVVYSVSVAVFPLVADSFWPAVGVRFVDGAATVAIWVSCETILLSRAGEKHKAYATTLYGISIALGYMIGPFMLWVATLLVTQMPSEAAFYGAGIIVVCTAALVFLRLDEDRSGSQDSSQPELGQSEAPPQTPFSALTWRIKTSCFGTFAYGYFQASVVLFLPLFLMAEKGIAKNDTKMIIGFFALGMLLFSNKAGQLGDRYGHLLLMRLLGVVGTVTVMAFVFLDAFWMMAIAVTLAGATLATISPVSLALQGVIVEPNDYSRSNAIYNAFYAFGMLLGPFLTSRILAAYSGAAMLYHLAALWAVFVVFSIIFSRDDPAARSDSTPESGPSADAFV